MAAAHPGDDAEAAGVIAAFGNLDVGEMFRREAKPRRGVIGNVVRAKIDGDHRGGLRNRSDDGPGFAKTVRVAKRFSGIVALRRLGSVQLGQLFGNPGPGRSGLALRSSELSGPVGKRLTNHLADLGDLIDAHECVDFGQEFRQFVAKALRHAAGNDQRLAPILGLAQFGGLKDGIHAFLLRGVDERAGVDDERVGLSRVVCHLHAPFEQRAEHDLGVHQIFGATQGNQAYSHGAFCGIHLHQRTRNLREVATAWQWWKPDGRNCGRMERQRAAGKLTPRRSADIPVGGFWGLSSPQCKTLTPPAL
jgi:hypothetical protein